ncbi:MAG: S8 family serine peptidase [Clostridia bacterium]|nr:S8 family serine peptidase [Clostridia bacterium]
MKKKAIAALAAAIMFFSTIVCAQEYDSYIVKLKKTNGISLMSAENSVLEPVVEEWGFYKVSADELEGLDMSRVEYVEPNYKIELLDEYPNDPFFSSQWNMSLVNAPYAWSRGFFGSGVKVAVFDSGIDTDHPDLVGRIKLAKDYTHNDNAEDVKGHGTMVSGIIGAAINNGVGVAGLSQADIYSFKIIHNGSSNEYDASSEVLFQAMHDAVKSYGCSIMNLSLGFTSETGSFSPKDVKAFNDAVNEVYKEGAIVIAASGNDANKGNPITYPAACDNVISVGAVDKNKNIAPYSTYNNMVDVVAAGGASGGGVVSTAIGGDYASGRGTSFAAPQVSAAAAIVKGIRPDLTYEKMNSLLKYSAEDLGEVGHDEYYGWGLLNMEKLIRLAQGGENSLMCVTPIYDAKSNSLTVSYYNGSNKAGENVCLCAAVYSGSGMSYISQPRTVTFPCGDETEVVFENISAESGDKIKVLCFKNLENIMPASDAAELEIK